MKKQLLSTLLALCMVVTLLPGTTWAAETSGRCGENMAWSYSDGISICSSNSPLTNATIHYNSIQSTNEGITWQGHRYQILDNHASTWAEAETYCESLGGHLATISCQEENDFIYQLMIATGYTSAFFGLTDHDKEGTWTWVTGETLAYTNWHPGEPNSENANEDYAMFYYKFKDGTWNDGAFGKGSPFICEWDPMDQPQSDQNSGTGSKGGFQISANTATTCLKKGTTFEMNVAYYQNDAIDFSTQEFIAVSSDSNVLDLTAGSWNDETGRQYIVTAKQAGNCFITFTNPSNGTKNRIDFTVIDGEMGYTFDSVPKMTIEEGKTTNFYNFSGLVVDDFAYTLRENTSGNIDYYDVTMIVYNTKNLYGTVASYYADGEVYECSVIDKHSNYSTSFVGDLKELKNSIGDLFYLLKNDRYYSGESISKKTAVCIKVPAGGYLQISNSLSSETATFANVIGLLVDGTVRAMKLNSSSDKLMDKCADIVDAVLNDSMKTLSAVLTDDFVEKQVSSELKKAAQKAFKTGTWNLDNYGDSMQSFLDILTELGIDLADNIAKKFNDIWGVLSVTESVVMKVIPIGNLIKFLYSSLGVLDESLLWLNFQASANFPSGIFIYAPSAGDSYQSNGVSVTPSIQKDSNVVVHAYLVVDTEDISGNKYETYSINMYRDGEKIQPDATITVRIPLSEKFKGLDRSTIKVYRYNDDGTITNMNATVVDGYAVFETNHLSYYSIVAEENSITPGESNTFWVNPFTDVSESDWFYEGVSYTALNGLMNGTSATTFEPNVTTNRAMIVTILYRLEQSPVTGGVRFNDVASETWYTEAVAWTSANGIVDGYGNGNFGPNDPITREQIATILYRYASYKGYDMSELANLSSYTDVGAINNWALTAMRWTNSEGLITGRTTTTLVPNGTTTRAEAATILMRFCQNVAGLE